MKTRTKRKLPLSFKWRKLVISQLGFEPTKETNNQINKLWADGYSHKDTVSTIKEVS